MPFDHNLESLVGSLGHRIRTLIVKAYCKTQYGNVKGTSRVGDPIKILMELEGLRGYSPNSACARGFLFVF